jgi:septal ring factor EnvC (AmiA/AmiB activator)
MLREDWHIIVAFLLMIAVFLAAAWHQPSAEDAANLEEKTVHLEHERNTAIADLKQCSQNLAYVTTARDKIAAELEDFEDWNNRARVEIAALTAQLSTEIKTSTVLRFQLAQAPPQPRVIAATMVKPTPAVSRRSKPKKPADPPRQQRQRKHREWYELL